MSPGPTFDRVYLALKEQLGSGRSAPGDHLEPAVLGEELHASITPVRDALHRLVGERIVEAPRNDGFRAPAPTEAELRHLYGWNGALLEFALRGRAARATLLPSPNRNHADSGLDGPADLFRRIARRSGNPEHEAAVENLSDRLAAMRIAEAAVLDDVTGELSALAEALEGSELVALRRGLGAYHRRRQRCVPEILLAARTLADDRQ